MENQYSPKEIMSAAPDVFARSFGKVSMLAHPVTSALSIGDIAYACGLLARTVLRDEPRDTIMARGLSTSDFNKLLNESATAYTIGKYEAAAAHLRYCKTIKMHDFKSASLPALDGDVDLLEIFENGLVTYSNSLQTAGAAEVKIRTYAKAVRISEQLILNDQLQGLQAVFGEFAASAARLEQKLIAERLEDTAQTLDDGQLTFNASNVYAEVLNAANLGTAMATLRRQSTLSGNATNLPAETLLVSPELEYAARLLVYEAGLPCRVDVLAGLAATRWVLLADAPTHPVIGLLRLGEPVTVTHQKATNGASIAVKVQARTEACLLRRTGVLRCGA